MCGKEISIDPCPAVSSKPSSTFLHYRVMGSSACSLIIALSLHFFLPIAMAAPVSEEKNNCIQCHEFMGDEMGKPVYQWYGSTHPGRLHRVSASLFPLFGDGKSLRTSFR